MANPLLLSMIDAERGLIAVLAGLLVGSIASIAMRRLARRSSRAGAFLLVVLLPLIPGFIGAASVARGNMALWVAQILPVLSIVGGLLGLAVLGLLLVALADFFIAHADMASNSWFRSRS